MSDHHSRHAHPHPADTDDDALPELLDLDAEVLHAYLSDVIGWVGESAGAPAPRRILDLGTGTGTGALALLRRFADADVVAVDQSSRMLHRLRDKARALGLDHRVHTVEADLDGPWPAVGPVDLVWASASLHHMADPDRALAEIAALLRPGGLLAVAELDSFPRFLPDDAGPGAPGLEARVHAVLARLRAEDGMHLDADWGARLRAAGFDIVAERPCAIELTAPLPAATGRYAQASLRRARAHLDGLLSAEDLAALDTLTADEGPGSVLHRDDLTVRAARTVWLAVHP